MNDVQKEFDFMTEQPPFLYKVVCSPECGPNPVIHVLRGIRVTVLGKPFVSSGACLIADNGDWHATVDDAYRANLERVQALFHETVQSLLRSRTKAANA